METFSTLGDIAICSNVFRLEMLKFCLPIGRLLNIAIQVQVGVFCLKIHGIISEVNNKIIRVLKYSYKNKI